MLIGRSSSRQKLTARHTCVYVGRQTRASRDMSGQVPRSAASQPRPMTITQLHGGVVSVSQSALSVSPPSRLRSISIRARSLSARRAFLSECRQPARTGHAGVMCMCIIIATISSSFVAPPHGPRFARKTLSVF